MTSCLIRDVLVVPPERTAPRVGWVRVDGGVITAVEVGSAPQQVVDDIVNGEGCALIPGLVNTHAHSHSSLTRGTAEGLALDEWLKTIEAEQSRLTPEQAKVGALATYAEALLSGTTTIMDMCLHPQQAFAAASEIGIRAVIAPYVADGKSFTPRLTDTANLIEMASRQDGRVRAWVGLHDLESCSDDQIRAGADLARKNGVGIHLHCSETSISVERTRARTGLTPVAQLAKLEALGPQTLLAHCVWVDANDRKLLAACGVHVAHCPHANLKLGSGIAPIPDLIGGGANVALATDGAKANNRLDLFDVMKFASLLHKGVARDPTVLPPGYVLDMATRRGGLALAAPIGAIAVGMAADLVMVGLDKIHLQPAIPETVRTNLVHAARGSDVTLTMVAGRILVRDGRLTPLPEDVLRDQARAVGVELTQAGSGGAA
jgi:5-methylthioadenosine/S-adenosylhomocysteine deaminase